MINTEKRGKDQNKASRIEKSSNKEEQKVAETHEKQRARTGQERQDANTSIGWKKSGR